MSGHEVIEPEYSGTVGGAYSTEEHLHAQQVQTSAQTGKPLHDPDSVAHPAPAGDHDDPAAPLDPTAGDSGPEGANLGEGQSGGSGTQGQPDPGAPENVSPLG